MMKLRKLPIILVAAGLVLFLLLFFLWQFVPGYLDSRILPGLADQNGVEWQSGRIRTIRLTGFDAGGFVIGGDGQTGIAVNAVHVDYTPFGLLQKRINRIAISGLTLNIDISDDGVAISGIDLKKTDQKSKDLGNGNSDAAQEEKAKNPDGNSPAVDRFEINNAVLNLGGKYGQWQIPFSVSARLAPSGEVDAILTLYLCGQKVLVSTRWSQADSNGEVSLAADAMSFENMTAVLKFVPGLVASGDIDLKAGANISLTPFEIKGVMFSLESKNLNASFGKTGLQALSTDGPSQNGLYLNVQQTDKNRFALTGGNLVVQSTAVPLVLDKLDGRIDYGSDDITTTMKMVVRLPAFGETAAIPVALQKDVALGARISGKYAMNGDWQFNLENLPAGKGGTDAFITLTAGETRVAAGTPRYRVNAKGRGARADGRFNMSIDDVRAQMPAGVCRLSRVELQGGLGTETSGGGIAPRMSATLKVTDIKTEITPEDASLPVKIAIPEIETKMHAGPDADPAFNGEFILAESSVSAPAYQVQIDGIRARIPWQWPVGERVTGGSFSISDMRWQHLDMGSIQMAIGQTPEGVTIQGEHINTQLPGLKFSFSVDADIKSKEGVQTRFKAFISRPDSAPEIDLGRFVESAEGVYFKGVLGAEFRASHTASGFEGSVCARLDRSNIRIPDKGVTLGNIGLGLCFPDLPALTSGPSQVLSFGKVSAGGIKLDGGIVHFQLEPYKTLFIEKGQVKWCQGKIRLQPMRITPGIEEYETRLDCDRLNLAQILGQLGVANAQGEGAVNGTIPISIKKGQVRFDDGFLYSTPGSGGKIRLSGADTLLAGIPEGTRQYFQVDLAREALKDFYYNWAKLRLVSEEETLRMRLQFDGKPGNILPFEYDESFGGFIRVDAASRGSEFQGISLDVNFRVPLNDLLEHREILELFKQN